MRTRLTVLPFCMVLLWVTACTAPTETAVSATPPAPTAVSTIPLPATPTRPPTAVPTAPPTAPPTPTANPLAISPENAGQLTVLAQLGNGRIDSLTWLPAGDRLAVGTSLGIDLYDSQTLQPGQTIRDEQIGGTVHLHYSPAGDYLLITMGGYETDRVTLWDAAGGHYIRDLYDAFAPHFAPGGELVYFDWAAQQLVWHDPASGETRQTRPLPFAPRAFTLTGGLLVELYLDKTLRLYGLDDLALRHTLELPDVVDDIAFSPAGEMLAAASRDGRIRLWHAPDGTLRHDLEGMAGWVSRVAFSADGRILAAWVSGAEEIRLWDTATGQLRHTFPVAAGCGGSGIFAFNPDGQTLAAVSGAAIHLYDLASGALRLTVENGYCLAADAAFHPSGASLILTGGSTVTTLSLPTAAQGESRQTDLPLSSLAISPDGQLMAIGGGQEESVVQLWSPAAGQPLRTLRADGLPVHRLVFSPDGELLAAQSGYDAGSVVRLWRPEGGAPVADFGAHTFAFSPDGRFLALSLAAAAEETAVTLWDSESGQLLPPLPGLALVGYGPDGAILAAEQDAAGQVQLAWWDGERGERLRSFGSMEGPGRLLAFGPDGRLLLGFDNGMGTLGLWDAAAGQRVWGGGLARTAVLSGDGRYLAVVRHDGIVQLWGLRP